MKFGNLFLPSESDSYDFGVSSRTDVGDIALNTIATATELARTRLVTTLARGAA